MKALNAYTRKRFKQLRHLLESVKDSDDPEILHKIRVEVKKLKAILGLVHFAFPSLNTHKIYVPLRAIFRKADEIRKPYTIENHLKHYGINTSSHPGIFTEKRSVKTFRKKISTFLAATKKSEKKIEKRIRKTGSKDLSRYLKRREKELLKRLFPEIELSRLHQTRKLIKEILYLSSVLKRELHPFFSESETLIGEWNDKQVVIQLLRKSELPHASAIHKLEQECEHELQTLQRIVADYYTLR